MSETKYTYCRLCEPNCGLEVTLEGGKIVKVAGDKAHPLSRGYICNRGRHSLEVHNDPDRARFPLKKENGKWKRISWDDALGEVAAKFNRIRREYGPHAVAVYMGNPVAFDSYLAPMVPAFAKALGTRNLFTAGSQDCNNKFVATEKVYGSPLIQFIPDVDNMEFLIIVGSNPAVSHMSFVSLTRPIERLREVEKRGGKVVVIDPRRTETARLVGEHIFIRPDTDVFLLLAFLNEIIKRNLYRQDLVADKATGFNELKTLAAGYPAERAAEVTGIPAARIKELAEKLATTPKAGLYASLGINLGRFGTIDYWLVQAINFITGHLDQVGGMMYCSGLVNMPRLFSLANFGQKPVTSRIGGFSPVLDSLPAGIMADEILTSGQGQIRALITISGNPLLTVPNAAKLEKAFKSLELIVALDLYVNETASLGHYVLPATDFYEREDFPVTGLMFRPELFLQFTPPMIAPDGEQRDSWQVLRDLMRKMGVPFMGNKAVDLVARGMDQASQLIGPELFPGYHPRFMVHSLLAMARTTLGRLKKDHPHGTILRRNQAGDFFRKYILTLDKKIHLAPPEFMAEARKLDKVFTDEKRANGRGFLLIGQRQRTTHNTWLHNVEALVAHEKTNRVTIHEKDAAKLGIKDGDKVKVKSKTGAITLPALVSPDIMPGVVSIPHGWGHNYASGLSVAKKYPGVNVNFLAPDGPEALEPFAGMARLNGIPVTLAKATQVAGKKKK